MRLYAKVNAVMADEVAALAAAEALGGQRCPVCGAWLTDTGLPRLEGDGVVGASPVWMCPMHRFWELATTLVAGRDGWVLLWHKNRRAAKSRHWEPL